MLSFCSHDRLKKWLTNVHLDLDTKNTDFVAYEKKTKPLSDELVESYLVGDSKDKFSRDEADYISLKYWDPDRISINYMHTFICSPLPAHFYLLTFNCSTLHAHSFLLRSILLTFPVHFTCLPFSVHLYISSYTLTFACSPIPAQI